jgi:hypothetical protein
MSRVYRFHGPADLPATVAPMLLRKRRKRTPEPLHLIGVDTSTVTDRNCTLPIEAYVAPAGQLPVTLTRRESDLIALANPGIPAPEALEDLHPWLPECRFLNDSVASIRAAESIIRRFGHHLVSASSYCDERWNTICNALRLRSVLDARFYAAWHLPIQEVHVLEESRADRCVVAIDFNGMYPACMQYGFPKPSDLRQKQLDTDLDDCGVLAAGLYRCVLEGPTTDFIIRHNPFRSFHSGRHLRTRLDEPVEIALNEFEIAFFRRHFRRIHLVEAVIADKVVEHPLAKEVRRSFARRRNYRQQGNKALADREKYLATLMTSCANRPARAQSTFATRDQAMDSLRTSYGIDVPFDEPEAAANIWLEGRKGILLGSRDGLVIVRGPALHDGSACYLLGQRIVARGRIRLLEMMERVLASAPDVQICYANIDSIHFSLPARHRKCVIAWLESEASDAMGSFKIEAVTQHGLWLEPGRYWLYSEGGVDKFRNRGVGDRRQPFRDHAIHVVNRRLGGLHVPVRATLRMDRTMSATRSLDIDAEVGVTRQTLIEVGDATTFGQVLDQLERNHRQYIPARMNAFVDLREELDATRITASMRVGEGIIM